MFKISDWFKLILCTVLSSGVAFGGNFGQMNFAYWQIPPASNPTATYLVVAGGGGGGGGGSTWASEGGGGAGGLLTSTATLTVGTTYTITVGSNGTGAVGYGGHGTSGNNSIISGSGLTTVTAIGGGGGGGGAFLSGTEPPLTGGSGGGGAGYNTTGAAANVGAAGTTGQGYAGGNGVAGLGTAVTNAGGGGGGSSSVGTSGSVSTGGNGGSGTSSSITGSSVTYAGGGGGGGGTGGSGGSGGGGAGGTGNVNGNTATGYGSGGGGAGALGSGGGTSGGNGSSGVVIVSLPTGFGATTTGTVTVTTNGTNTVYTFTSSGTLTPYSGLARYSNYTTNNGTYLISSSIAAVGSGNWTAEYWVYMISITGTGGNGVHFDTRNYVNDNNYAIYASTSGSGYVLNCILFNAVRITSSTTQSYNTWYHVALVKNSSTTTLYVNGTGVGTYSDTNTYTANPLTLFNSGIPANGYQYGYNGYISNFRITTTAVYTANFTPPTTPLTAITGTIILTCNSSTISDQGPNSYSFTNTGPITVSTFSPF